jgi:hypothetical protein
MALRISKPMLVMSQRSDTVARAEEEAVNFCARLEDEHRGVRESPFLPGVGLLICSLLQDRSTLVS